jgi:hypothetical protein
VKAAVIDETRNMPPVLLKKRKKKKGKPSEFLIVERMLIYIFFSRVPFPAS